MKKESKKMSAAVLEINCSNFFIFFKYLIVNRCINEINVVFQKMFDNDFYLLPTNNLYKKEDTRQLKNFLAGYVWSFYRNLADNVDNFIGSDFYSRITADADIPREDVQKYILATSDFAKSIQTDINHYVT